MQNDKEKQMFLVQIMLVIFLTLLIAYPVTFYIKKANNPDQFLTQEQLKAIQTDKYSLSNVVANTGPAPLETEGGLSVGKQTTRYSNTGQAIISVNIYNITKLSKDDFTKVGQTPWSLMNTVKSNMATPQVLDLVFNNDAVVQAFMTRPSVVALTADYLKVYDMLMQGNYAIEKFVTNPTVEAAINDEKVLNSLANSKLIRSILSSKAGLYFINNPAVTKKLIANNEPLKKVLANENIKKQLLTNPYTKRTAPLLYQ